MLLALSAAPYGSGPAGFGTVWEVQVASARDPRAFYRVRQLASGGWMCECPAYLHGSRSDGLCRHVDFAQDLRSYSLTFASLLAGA